MSRDPALAKIHIARKQLGLSEEDYRALLRRAAGVESAAGLSPEAYKKILDAFKKLGFKAKPAAFSKRRAGGFAQTASNPPGGRAHVQKVLDLWREANTCGAISDGSESALRAFVKRQTKGFDAPDGIAAPQFLTPQQANKVIEGLKAILLRARRKAGAAQ